jgi:hypothetical protein
MRVYRQTNSELQPELPQLNQLDGVTHTVRLDTFFSGPIRAIYKAGRLYVAWVGIVLVTPQKRLAVTTNLSHRGLCSTQIVENGARVKRCAKHSLRLRLGTDYCHHPPNIALW